MVTAVNDMPSEGRRGTARSTVPRRWHLRNTSVSQPQRVTSARTPYRSINGEPKRHIRSLPPTVSAIGAYRLR